MPPPAEPGPAASLALAALVTIVVASPWAFGAVQKEALLAMALASLLVSALVLVAGAWGGGSTLPALPLWPLAGFLAAAVFQLVPLPQWLHRSLAPGSSALWHPADPATAAVLGAGARPVSVDPDTTLVAVALTGGLALLALLAAPALTRPRLAVRAVSVVGAAGFALSAYAILARARFGSLLYGRIAVQTVAPFGPFVSKNHFAGWIAMATLLVAGLALGLADDARRRGRDWTTGPRAASVILSLVAALAMALAALASLSRGGVIALAAGVACLLGLRLLGAGRKRAAVVPALVLTATLGAVLLALVPQEAQERIRSLSGASFRLDTWRDTLRLAAASPAFGHGLGAFHDAYPRFKQGQGIVRVEHAENDYLETLAETGLVGLALALTGVVLLVGRAGRGIASSRGEATVGVAQGAVAALAALAVHSAVDFDLRIPSNAALAALVAAATAAASGLRPRALARPLAALIAAGIVGVGVAAATRPDRPWLTARAEAIAAASATSPAVRQLRLERAEAALSQLLSLRPGHAESWLLLAGTQAALGRRESAAALAHHAVWLDPERPGLREAAARIETAP